MAAAKKKDFTGDPGRLIGDAIWSVIKPLYKEAKKLERGQARAAKESFYEEKREKVSQKDIVLEVLPRAITRAGQNFSQRDLYYAIRTLAYAHDDWEEDRKLDYGYYGQLINVYEREVLGRRITGLYRDPRGNLHEPHGGKTVPLGTLAVADYEFPEFVFDKILYVEKEGELPKLRAAKLGERFDMAICSGKGQPTEAVRSLFERAEKGDFQLFVFHDADLSGYDIARVMGEETARMPGYSVEIIDLGLSIEDALEMGLESEPYSQNNKPSEVLVARLSEVARAYLLPEPQPKKGAKGERFELNAILPDTARVEHIERKLEENGVRAKVVPPEEKLLELSKKMFAKKVDTWTAELISELLEVTGLKKKLAEGFEDSFKLQGAKAWIERGFELDDSKSWRGVVDSTFNKAYAAKHKAAMSEAIWEYIKEKTKEVEESEDE